jgi:hypothetical protein
MHDFTDKARPSLNLDDLAWPALTPVPASRLVPRPGVVSVKDRADGTAMISCTCGSSFDIDGSGTPVICPGCGLVYAITIIP